MPYRYLGVGASITLGLILVIAGVGKLNCGRERLDWLWVVVPLEDWLIL